MRRRRRSPARARRWWSAARGRTRAWRWSRAIQKAGGTAKFIRADVAKEADVKAVVEGTVKEFGRLDVLFNNAGIEGKNGPIGDPRRRRLRRDLRGQRPGHLAGDEARPSPSGEDPKGTIVNNSSVVADIGFPNSSIYSATKGAVNALTRTAAMEFIPQGVRVNAVAPGPIETDMAARMFGGLEASGPSPGRRFPRARPGRVEDIAEAVLYLASPEARFVVGQVLTVDGGLSVH